MDRSNGPLEFFKDESITDPLLFRIKRFLYKKK